MSIYVIGDLHLSFSENKPMDIFGDNWSGHEEKIKKDWLEKIKKDDVAKTSSFHSFYSVKVSNAARISRFIQWGSSLSSISSRVIHI